jgi:antitoxin component of MazEF toxin-antitoxin module
MGGDVLRVEVVYGPEHWPGDPVDLEVRLDNGMALGRFPVIGGDPTGDRIKLEDLLEAVQGEAVEKFREEMDWNEVGI